MTHIPTSIRLHTVIAIAKERVSTPEAYSALDSMYSDFDGSASTGGDAYYPKMCSALTMGADISCGLFNAFEAAVLPRCVGAQGIKKLMLDVGATSVLMSGSGPSVYGIFKDEETARAAESALRNEKYSAWYAQTV